MILLNLGREPFQIQPGDRIAQMVIARYEAVEWEEGELAEFAARRGRIRIVGTIAAACYPDCTAL